MSKKYHSDTMLEHVLRGVIGVAAIVYAIRIGADHTGWSLALGVVAVVMFRGCPVCWVVGFADTLRLKKKEPSKPLSGP